MTIPAPSASSTSPQQPGSSASASGQAPTIAHDTVTQGTSVTGLMGVFAERDARDVADKIAQAVRSYVQRHNQDSDQNKQIQEIRVTGDLSALSDINTLRILTGQATQLKSQVAEYVKSVPSAEQQTKRPGRGEQEHFVADALTAAGTLLGLVTQLVAGTYTYSGQPSPNASIGGLDILVANKLKSETGIPVHVDRIATMPPDSHILKLIQGLVPSAAEDLNPALSRAAWDAAAKAQVVADDKDRLTQIDAEKTALLKSW
jgi:exonuclease V gamma subunit